MNDANALRKAMKGFGTDENTLINILCRRSNEQRQHIAREFKTCFGKDLINDIRSETSGNFEECLVALLTPIVEYYVTQLRGAMAGMGTDEDVLIETLCTLSNYEIGIIKNAYYHSKYFSCDFYIVIYLGKFIKNILNRFFFVSFRISNDIGSTSRR